MEGNREPLRGRNNDIKTEGGPGRVSESGKRERTVLDKGTGRSQQYYETEEIW